MEYTYTDDYEEISTICCFSFFVFSAYSLPNEFFGLTENSSFEEADVKLKQYGWNLYDKASDTKLPVTWYHYKNDNGLFLNTWVNGLSIGFNDNKLAVFGVYIITTNNKLNEYINAFYGFIKKYNFKEVEVKEGTAKYKDNLSHEYMFHYKNVAEKLSVNFMYTVPERFYIHKGETNCSILHELGIELNTDIKNAVSKLKLKGWKAIDEDNYTFQKENMSCYDIPIDKISLSEKTGEVQSVKIFLKNLYTLEEVESALKKILVGIDSEAEYTKEYGSDDTKFLVFESFDKSICIVYACKFTDSLHVEHVLTFCTADFYDSFFAPMFRLLERLKNELRE